MIANREERAEVLRRSYEEGCSLNRVWPEHNLKWSAIWHIGRIVVVDVKRVVACDKFAVGGDSYAINGIGKLDLKVLRRLRVSDIVV